MRLPPTLVAMAAIAAPIVVPTAAAQTAPPVIHLPSAAPAPPVVQVPLAVAAPPAVPAPVSAEARALSQEIALLVNPPQTMTDYFRADSFRLQMRAGFSSNPGLAQLESEHPGILDAVLRRIQPLLADEMTKLVPDMIDRIAAIYAERLTVPEMREAAIFYRSPLGQRVIAGINAQAFKQGVDIGMRNADDGSDTTARQVQSVATSAGWTALSTFSAQERTEILRFSTAPTGRRLSALAPAVSATVAAWVNEPRPEVQARINDAMLEEAGAFIANEKKP